MLEVQENNGVMEWRNHVEPHNSTQQIATMECKYCHPNSSKVNPSHFEAWDYNVGSGLVYDLQNL